MTIFGKKKIYDSKIDLTPIFVLKKKFEIILFLREVINKIVFSPLIAVNEMFTSHSDNLSTYISSLF